MPDIRYEVRRKHWIALLAVGMAGAALAANAPPITRILGHSPDAASVLDHKYIFVKSDGAMDISYDLASKVFDQPDMLGEAQRAYARLLPEGETPEFTIQKAAPNHWYYVNSKSQRSDVKELHRHTPSDDALDLVYFTVGKRFFGEFRSLVHVHATRSDEDKVHFAAEVYAYPTNPLVRFFVRQLNLVEKFFDEKTAHMTEIVTDIAYYLCDEAKTAKAEPAAEAEPARTR